METSIRIKLETKKKLNLLKYKLDAKSIDDVISRMYNIIVKMKLANELKENGK